MGVGYNIIGHDAHIDQGAFQRQKPGGERDI